MAKTTRNFHETAVICTQGHVLTDSLESHQEFLNYSRCSSCGSILLKNCPVCKAKISGQAFHELTYSLSNGIDIWGNSAGHRLHSERKIAGRFMRPSHCHNCGEPYSWTTAAIQEFEEIIELSEELDEPEKAIHQEKFPLLLSEQPGTISAALQISKILKPVMNTTGQALKSAVASKIVGVALSYFGWK